MFIRRFPVDSSARLFGVLTYAALSEQLLTAFGFACIEQFASKRRWVVEGRRQQPFPAISCSPPQNAPVFVVAVGVPDQRIQREISRELGSEVP